MNENYTHKQKRRSNNKGEHKRITHPIKGNKHNNMTTTLLQHKTPTTKGIKHRGMENTNKNNNQKYRYINTRTTKQTQTDKHATTNKHTNKQTNKQTHKQTNKQTNKQAHKQPNTSTDNQAN